MKKLLLGTTLLAGLAGPAFAQVNNSIWINDSAATVTTLSITQDDGNGGTTGNTYTSGGSYTNTVSAVGGTQMPVIGPWSSIAITQTGKGANTLTGALSSQTGSTGGLSATYTTTASGGTNSHTLLIGQNATLPTIVGVTINVANTATSADVLAAPSLVANNITDTIDSTGSLTYDLGLSDYNDTIVNTVSAGSGAVTLTEGYSTTGFDPTHYEGIGSTSGTGGNAVTNTLTSAGGAVTVKQYVNGSGNVLSNIITTNDGAITLTQGSTSTTGIVGTGNKVYNVVTNTGAGNSFVQTLYVNGSNNTIYGNATSSDIDTVNFTIGATSPTSYNTVTANITGGTTANLNLDTGSQYVNLYYTSAASTSSATVNVNDVLGSNGSPAIVAIQQTSLAAASQATLTVTGGAGATPGSTLSIPTGTTAHGGTAVTLAGIGVYQNSPGAVLSANVSGASGYTASFKQ